MVLEFSVSLKQPWLQPHLSEHTVSLNLRNDIAGELARPTPSVLKTNMEKSVNIRLMSLNMHTSENC